MFYQYMISSVLYQHLFRASVHQHMQMKRIVKLTSRQSDEDHLDSAKILQSDLSNRVENSAGNKKKVGLDIHPRVPQFQRECVLFAVCGNEDWCG